MALGVASETACICVRARTHTHTHTHTHFLSTSGILVLPLFNSNIFHDDKENQKFGNPLLNTKRRRVRGLWGRSWPTSNLILCLGTQQFTVGERVACQRVLCDWAKVEEYVKFKMKRQPSQLKAELGANGAGERGPFQRKVLICKLISPQQMLSGPLAKEFLDPGLPIELLVISSG